MLARLANSTWRLAARPEGLQFKEWVLRIPAFLAGLGTLIVLALLLRDLGLPLAGVLSVWVLAQLHLADRAGQNLAFSSFGQTYLPDAGHDGGRVSSAQSGAQGRAACSPMQAGADRDQMATRLPASSAPAGRTEKFQHPSHRITPAGPDSLAGCGPDHARARSHAEREGGLQNEEGPACAGQERFRLLRPDEPPPLAQPGNGAGPACCCSTRTLPRCPTWARSRRRLGAGWFARSTPARQKVLRCAPWPDRPIPRAGGRARTGERQPP